MTPLHSQTLHLSTIRSRLQCNFVSAPVADISDTTGGVAQSIADNYFYYVDSWDVDTMYPGLEDVRRHNSTRGQRRRDTKMVTVWSRGTTNMISHIRNVLLSALET